MTGIEQAPTGRQILDVPMQPNDADATTIRGYLIALLAGVWEWREGFDGKRPFGNSGWASDLYEPLVKAGHITGTFDEDGYLEEVDSEKGRELIASAIQALAEPEPDQVKPWTSVFYRYHVEQEETHTTLEDALTFLHEGWNLAQRSPVAIKGPDGQTVMHTDDIAADRRKRGQA